MAARLTERIRSLGYIASLVNAGSALDEILDLIVTAVCQRSSWSSSAIMAADEAAGHSVLVARYDPLFGGQRRSVDRWTLDTSPIRAVLRDRRPIIIEDAQASAEFPAWRREATERDYHSVVLLPFSTVDEMGRDLVLSVHAHRRRKVDEGEIAFLETVALLGSLAVEKAHRLRLDARQTARLQAALDIHSLAMEQVLSTEDLGRFAELFSRHLPHSFLLVDLTANRLVAGGPPGRLHECDPRAAFLRLAPTVRAAEMGGFQTTRDIQLGPVERCSVVLEPCIAAGAVLGGIVLLSEGRELDAAEALTAQELRAAFSVLLLRQRIRFEALADTHGEFFARLFTADWRDGPAMLARAHHLGLPLDAPARLAAIRLPEPNEDGDGARAEIAHALSRLLQQRLPGGTAFQDGDLLILFLPERKGGAAFARKILGQMLQEVEWSTRSNPTACLGQLCSRLEDYRGARREAGTMLDLARRTGRSGIVEAGDFGPLARFVALADSDGLHGFVDETIGRIVRHDAAHDGRLVETLARYLSLCCRPQATADALGIHVSTCRYRLQRLRDLFGLDLDDPDTRLGLELALLVNRDRAFQPEPAGHDCISGGS